MKKRLIALLGAITIIASSSSPVMAVFASETPAEANIETSNVSYDLKMLYGKEKWQDFDLNTLIPTKDSVDNPYLLENGDFDLTFKFLCIKPVDDSLYLYAYSYEKNNLDVDHMKVNVSKSKTLASNGEFVENYTNYPARYINSYGYQGRFHKFCIDGSVSVGNDIRFYIKDANILYTSKAGVVSSTGYYSVEHNFVFNVDDNKDLVYEYFTPDYIRVTDADVVNLMVGKDRVNFLHQNVGASATDVIDYYTAYEHFYYFFDTDKRMDQLIGIKYIYELVSWTADYKDPALTACFDVGKKDAGVNPIFLMKDSKNVVVKGTEKLGGYIENKKVSRSVSRPSFLWWNQTVEYELDTIIDCRDLSKITDKTEKTFIEAERKKADGTTWNWAFELTTTLREVQKAWLSGIFMISQHVNSNSLCHEVKQAMITQLKFVTDNQKFELNALDIPRDTSHGAVGYVPFETLPELLWRTTKSFFTLIGGALNGLFNNLYFVLAIIICVALFVFVVPAITPVLNFASSVKLSKQSRKMQKEYKKQNKRKNE